MLTGCAFETDTKDHESSEARDECPSLDFRIYDDADLMLLQGLSTGEFISNGGQANSKPCIVKRICELSDALYERYGQSYYVSADSYGAHIIKQQFPLEYAKALREIEQAFNTFEMCQILSTSYPS